MKESIKKNKKQDNIETGYEPTGHTHIEPVYGPRDRINFAGLAMQALIMRNDNLSIPQLCREAFSYADNMMDELEISYAKSNKKS